MWIYCATANPVEVVIGETEQGRGILGVIDGEVPLGVESDDDVTARSELLRTLGYKLALRAIGGSQQRGSAPLPILVALGRSRQDADRAGAANLEKPARQPSAA